MKLLTKLIEKKLPALYATEELGDEAICYLKLFTPWSHWTWYATEYDPETGTFFGLVQGLEEELGYFTLEEIQSIKGPAGLKVERDMYWIERPLSECRKEAA